MLGVLLGRCKNGEGIHQSVSYEFFISLAEYIKGRSIPIHTNYIEGKCLLVCVCFFFLPKRIYCIDSTVIIQKHVLVSS